MATGSLEVSVLEDAEGCDVVLIRPGQRNQVYRCANRFVAERLVTVLFRNDEQPKPRSVAPPRVPTRLPDIPTVQWVKRSR